MIEETLLKAVKKYLNEDFDGIVLRMIPDTYHDIALEIHPLITCRHCVNYDEREYTCLHKDYTNEECWCNFGRRKTEDDGSEDK